MTKFLTMLLIILAFAIPMAAQDNSTPDSVFPHLSDKVPVYTSGQTNTIFQWNPPFTAKYTGIHSFLPTYQKAHSQVESNYTGLRLSKYVETLETTEQTSGNGISQSFGLGGYVNLDDVRVSTSGKVPYFARALIHIVIPLSEYHIVETRSPTQIKLTEVPERRLEFDLGKFSLTDFFDINSVGSDSHFQFMNYTTAQNGVYDYAADTRGYSYGLVIQYRRADFSGRFAEMLMPTTANGSTMQWNLRRSHSENYEIEWKQTILPSRQGDFRFLYFENRANMGEYKVAVANWKSGLTATPDINAHPFQTKQKYGFGGNFQQTITTNSSIFGRWGWNDGNTETFCFTEVDSTVSLGIGWDGAAWNRPFDKAGIAWATNGISQAHQNYLSSGGLGFAIGDSSLRYGREQVLETYYTWRLRKGIYIGPDIQWIANPAYNQDRGPVLVGGFRIHSEL